MIIHMFFADSNVGLWDAKDPRLAEFLIELLDVRMHRNLPIQREVALDDSAMRFGITIMKIHEQNLEYNGHLILSQRIQCCMLISS